MDTLLFEKEKKKKKAAQCAVMDLTFKLTSRSFIDYN